MNDDALVAAMVRGDPRGLEGAYRRYADRLLAYCRGLLRDAEGAADAVHDTFIAAGLHAGRLRDPDRLQAWLYAIARNECHRQLRRRSRHVPIEEAGEMSAPVDNPDAAVFAGQVREVVWAAAQGLSSGDREVFELMLRHGLSAADVGAMLGVSADHAHARMSRSRAQLERSLGALLVARTGAADCADLAGLLHGWDGRLTPLLRKRIVRHVESCSTCAERRRTQLTPAALLSAYAGIPFLAAPMELWERINHTMAHPAQAAARQSIGDRTGGLDRGTGFPRPIAGGAPEAKSGHGGARRTPDHRLGRGARGRRRHAPSRRRGPRGVRGDGPAAQRAAISEPGGVTICFRVTAGSVDASGTAHHRRTPTPAGPVRREWASDGALHGQRCA